MEKKKVKLAIFGDGILETGFGRVLHSLAKFFHKTYKYDISWFGINCSGDPTPFPYRMYPTKTDKGPYGYEKTGYFLNKEQPDIIFLLNDSWILNIYLEQIKKYYKDKARPKIVIYTPVDAEDHDMAWYTNFDIVDEAVTYTEFGRNVLLKSAPGIDFKVIPHGIDSEDFFHIDLPIVEVKKKVYPNTEEFLNSFVFLNANRNQRRKRLDITLQAFSLFAKDKPDNVKLYMHSGITDQHINTLVLAERYGIDKRLCITTRVPGVQKLDIPSLNVLYNATDVGINTSIGEGWGLTNVEHAVTGAPQIVPNHSACRELFRDCGILVPANIPHVIENICTTGYVCRAEDVANAMQIIYEGAQEKKELYNSISVAGYNKFNSPQYSWKEIAKQWHKLFLGIKEA
jgi:D-inositol-3-phosphate glycosyltransferase